MFRTFCLLVGVIVCFGAVFPAALAQESAGLGLTPTLIEEGVDPGSSLTETITVKNFSEVEQTYYFFTRDIAGVESGGRPIYADPGQETTGQEVSSWITLERTQLTLPAGGTDSFSIVIDVPEDATPGSHFGGVFGSLNPPPDDTTGVGAAVGYQVGNIVSLRVSGDIVEQAVIRSLQTDRYFYGDKRVDFVARVENKGNVLIRPRGPVEITNMLGDVVASPMMNESQNGVYPDSIRELTAAWGEDGLGFGKYTAMAALIYGEPGEAQQTMIANTTFWVLPWEIIRPLLIVLAVFTLLTYLFVRHYIKNQVRKLAGGRQLVRATKTATGPSVWVLLAVIMLFVTAFTLLIILLLFA